MYQVQIIVVNEETPIVAGDRPEVVKAFEVGGKYRKQALAEKFAHFLAQMGNVHEISITGKASKK